MTDEYILSNLLANILGLDASFASRFSDDPKYLYTTAEKSGISPESIKDFLNQMNYNSRMREITKKSMLPELEGSLVQMFSQINPTKEQIELFGGMLVRSPEEMDNPEFYSEDKLAVVGEQFKDVVKNLENTNIQDVSYKK